MQPTETTSTSTSSNPSNGHQAPQSAPRPDPQVVRNHHDLLATLMRELFQTEMSAELHPTREAQRLGEGAPARALRDVARHAEATLRELPTLARNHDLPNSWLGRSVGMVFSRVRATVADHLVDAERSYRGTLLGMRHGIDLVKLIRHVADASGQVEVGGFCTRWLEEREPLVAKVESAMHWFADHPEVAVHSGGWSPLSWRGRRAS